jgi:hypothetical protein
MIEILNLNPGDFFAHSIAYIFGKCHDSSNEIQLTDAIGETIKWKVRKFHFKVKNLNFLLSMPVTKGHLND